MLKNIRKILILKWGALGDVIASTPAINMVLKNFPDACIDIVTDTLFKEIFPTGETFYQNLYDIHSNKFELIKKIRKERYDLVINLKWTSEGAAWITWLSGARYRAGSGPENHRFAYNLKSDYIHGRCHEIIRNTSIIEGIGINGEKIKFISYFDNKSESKINDYFTKNNLDGNFIFGLHPGASKNSKSWLTERFIMAIDEIKKKYKIKILILYGKNDKNKAEQIVNQILDPNVLLGPETSSIRELTAITRRCNLFFCNNSGPMNLSVALGIPTVALLGSTHPLDWGPFGEENISIKSPLYLSSYSEDDEITAMKAIRTDKVIKIVSEKIAELI
jgi:ADP-heptose:LPS heptosyltransferase